MKGMNDAWKVLKGRVGECPTCGALFGDRCEGGYAEMMQSCPGNPLVVSE